MGAPEDVHAGTATIESLATGATRTDRLTARETAEDRIDAWQHRAEDDGVELQTQTLRAREILQSGTSADAIDFANEGVEQRAAAAASRWRRA
jgi:hypothetical protein